MNGLEVGATHVKKKAGMLKVLSGGLAIGGDFNADVFISVEAYRWNEARKGIKLYQILELVIWFSYLIRLRWIKSFSKT